jgi:hypothetical protein
MEVIRQPDGSFTLRRTCPMCLLPAEVHGLRKRALDRWDFGKGALVPDVFPQLSAAEREILVSGMHGSCYDGLFRL